MKTRTVLKFDSYILNIYKFDFDNLRTYFDKLIKAIDQENFKVISTADRLKQQGIPEEDIADILDEDGYNAGIFESNTYNLALVYLYTECEKTLKTQYRVIGDNKTKKMFQWDNVLSFFKDKGIDIKTNSHFAKLNEIRVINNCIKHDGYPSDELHNIDRTRWQQSVQISIKKDELNTFYKEARAFFDELVIELERVNNKTLLKEELNEVINLCKANLSSVDSDKQILIRDAIDKLSDL